MNVLEFNKKEQVVANRQNYRRTEQSVWAEMHREYQENGILRRKGVGAGTQDLDRVLWLDFLEKNW